MSGAKTLTSRTFALVFSLSLVVMLASAIAATAASFLSYEHEAEGYLLAQALTVADSLENSGSEESMRIELGSYPLVDTRCTLMRADGTVAYDNEVPADELDNHADREEIAAARESGSGITLRKSQTLGTDMLYAAVAMDDGHVLRLADTRTSLASFLGRMPLQLAIALVAIFGLSALAAQVITRMVVKPLRNIDLSRPLDNGAYGEIRPLLARVDSQTRKLQAQNEELKRAVSMRREFTGNVSHEMKSPLQVIGGYAELMENGMVDQKDIPHFAGLIRKEAGAMRGLIDDILTLSRLDEGANSAIEEVDVASACRRAVARLSAKSEGRGVPVEVKSDKRCTIRGNDHLIEQMAYNLIDNALAFSPDGDRITVDVSSSTSFVTLRVSDRGQGIPDEFKDRVFERFFRIDGSRARETGGTGLGLAIVKHVVESCGGEAHVEDNVPHGAVFVVTLGTPIADGGSNRRSAH